MTIGCIDSVVVCAAAVGRGLIMGKTIKKLMVIVLVGLAGSVAAEPFKEGEDYRVLDVPVVEKYSKGVVEFFSYACPFCYRAESVIEGLERGGVKVVRVPVHLGRSKNMAGAHAWFIAQELDLPPEFHRYTYEVVHSPLGGELQYNNLKYMEDLKKYFVGIGIPEEEYSAALKRVNASGAVEAANELAKQYKVPGTPSFLVNGQYMAAGVDDTLDGKSELEKLLRHLLTL